MLFSCSKVGQEKGDRFHLHQGAHYASVEASCSFPGVKECYRCDICNTLFFSKPNNENWYDCPVSLDSVDGNDPYYIPPLGHNYDKGVVTKIPTQIEEGEKTYTCLRCDYKKRETLLPLSLNYLSFDDDNYDILEGTLSFNNSNATSVSEECLIVNNKLSFVSGHLSFSIDDKQHKKDTGFLFCANDYLDVSFRNNYNATSYYYLSISEDNYISLIKKQGNSISLLSKVQLLCASPSITYYFDIYLIDNRIVCFVNERLFVDHFDYLPLDGSKFGFKLSNENSSVSINAFDNEHPRYKLIDLQNKSEVNSGSLLEPKSGKFAHIITKDKISKGSVVRFLGDSSIYKWSMCQLVEYRVDYSNGVFPYFADSGWNIDTDSFVGLDSLTSATYRDSYICLVVSRLDEKKLIKKEIDNLPNMFGIIESSDENEHSNSLFLDCDLCFGSLYNWYDKTVATLRAVFKLPSNTVVIFNGDTSLYKWSVIEKPLCFHNNTDLSKVEESIIDSRWNNDFNRLDAFTSDRRYLTRLNNAFLDLRISYIDGRDITSLDLENLFDFFSFQNIEWGNVPNRRDSVLSINHRGYCTEAPENTISAFQLSKANGFNMVETDVSITSDGVPVLLHDDTINRTARYKDGTAIDDAVNISDIKFEEAREYDYGIWKSEKYKGETIPSLEEFAEFCYSEGIHPYLELKKGISCGGIARCVEIIKQHCLLSSCTWISFDSNILNAIRFYDANSRLGLITGSLSHKQISSILSLTFFQGSCFADRYCYGVEYSAKICSAVNVPLEVWTVDSESILSSLPVYVSGVTSNLLNAKSFFREHK